MCTTSAPRHPARTCSLLTQSVTSDTRGFELRLLLSPPSAGALDAEALAGVLIGTGAPGEPYRSAALVHQAPAPGGGIFAGLDGAGRLVVKNFSLAQGGGNGWTISPTLEVDAMPELGASAETEWNGRAQWVTISWSPEQGGILRLAASDDGPMISPAWIPQRIQLAVPLERARVAGGLALFSSRGAAGSEEGFRFAAFQTSGTAHHPERARGPVIGSLYSLAEQPDGRHALRLTAQLAAGVGAGRVFLELEENETWKRVASASIEESAWIARFEVPGLALRRDQPFRLRSDLPRCAGRDFLGILRAPPAANEAWTLALLSCVKHQVGPLRWDHLGLWYPHADLLASIVQQDPDFVFFAGDQIYEGDLTPPDLRTPEIAILDYHTKWERFYDSFGELTRTRPCVVVPDDHDVFHGNLWGAGGVRAVARDGLTAQDAGGYKLDAGFVEVVHLTQTSHLPPRAPEIPERIGMGVRSYTTSFLFGGVDFAVLSDRMWKDSPSAAVPEAGFRNGWIQAEGFDPHAADSPHAQLLGPEQEGFLARWGAQRDKRAWTKVVLSQSPFAALQTLPAGTKSDEVVGRLKALPEGDWPPDDLPAADADSNGWPMGASRRARALLAAAGALHLAGDQHLGSAAWYGVDTWRDGTVAFTGPAMANTWPRRWMPAEQGKNLWPGALRGCGDFLDGFGNPVTVLAAANPRATEREPVLLHDRAPGYGIVRFEPACHTMRLEAWPRGADPHDLAQMFPGWPIEVGANGRPRAQD
ncbi:MAG: alkaline phosphatase D family protein [Planctomycetota bacterium]|nr:alkaline phosphatase D family protein [Planctomycetota bacterium]